MAFFSCFQCFKSPEQEDIQELDLSHFSLNDVPTEIFNFERTLEVLNLESNNIRDLPRQLFHCHGLRVLKLSDNDLHILPPAVSSLAMLQELDISKNVLTDIPDTIKQCKQLARFDASVNPLQKIPEGCTQLLSITELYLNDTFLEFLPANFGRLTKLRILELRENALNTLPKSLSRLTSLERLDLGQNEISELPEVIGSLTKLRELWIDGNRIKQIPSLIGNLKELIHLEASVNHIDYIADSISNCKLIQELALATNDLKRLPEAIGGLESLVTLKLDDNQIEELPMSIGKLKNLEELILSQNFLEQLPPSIGLCRKLHTLNVDDNDLDSLPREIGSCTGLRILSAHGNRLTSLPAELDHISNLSVINLTSNMIQHLPVSLTKLTRLTALWLSENQHKPLVQLNQETDPETGQRVLTNFMLPQTQTQVEYGGDISDTSSFHAASWEEEHAKRTHIKWAGDQKDEKSPSDSTSLRREPTPFPKEMRALAKRAKKIREQQLQKQQSQEPQPPNEVAQRKKTKEYRPRMQRKSSVDSQESSKPNQSDLGNSSSDGFVVIREAKVTSTTISRIESGTKITTSTAESNNQVAMDTSKTGLFTPTSMPESMMIKPSPTKLKPTTLFESPSRSSTVDESSFSIKKTDTFESVSSLSINHGEISPDQELRQFEAFEKAIVEEEHHSGKTSPEKNSRDSGVITPSEGGSLTSPDHSDQGSKPGHEDQLVSRPSEDKPKPVKAAVVTTELEDNRSRNFHPKPPPYHIAAAMSKHATDFNNLTEQSAENNRQEFDTVSESETSTAPSSLQTILRGPGFGYSYGVSEAETDNSPPSTPSDRAAPSFEKNFRQDSTTDGPRHFGYNETPPVPSDSPVAPLSKEHLQKLTGDRQSEKLTSESDVESMQNQFNHAQKLRKVSEQLLGNARTRQSFTGTPSSAVSKIPGSSRPSSRISHMGDSPFGNVAGRDMRPSSYAGPQNTVGLPPLLNTSLTESKIPKLNGGPRKFSQPPRLEDNGLLSTIEKAAMSDDDSPPPLPQKDDTPSLKKSSIPSIQSPLSGSRIPKIPTPARPPSSLSIGQQESNYENVASSGLVTSRPGQNISTANYVNSPSTSTPRLQNSPLPSALNRQTKIPVLPSSSTPTSRIPMRKT